MGLIEKFMARPHRQTAALEEAGDGRIEPVAN